MVCEAMYLSDLEAEDQSRTPDGQVLPKASIWGNNSTKRWNPHHYQIWCCCYSECR